MGRQMGRQGNVGGTLTGDPAQVPLAQASFVVIGSRSSHGVPSGARVSGVHKPLVGRQPPPTRQAEDGSGQTTPAQRSGGGAGGGTAGARTGASTALSASR